MDEETGIEKREERGAGVLERVYTISFASLKNIPKKQRARRSVKEIEIFMQKHMKSESIWIDNRVNEIIWMRGAGKPPSSVKVKATKFEDGLVEVVPLEK
jgi:large subunit ribosomal protein L31e